MYNENACMQKDKLQSRSAAQLISTAFVFLRVSTMLILLKFSSLHYVVLPSLCKICDGNLYARRFSHINTPSRHDRIQALQACMIPRHANLI